MAKLKAPLMSLGARSQLGKALVFFPWKGIDCVREYVIPSNPKTDPQLTQRGYLTAAVAEWHGAAYNAADRTAWNRLAGTLAKIMSGFNAMVAAYIAEAILGNTWERIHLVSTDTVQTTQFGVGCYKAAAGNAPTVRWGTSKTFLPHTAVMVDGGDGTWHTYATPLVANTLYYFTIDVGTSETDFGRVGLYQQRTAAA